MTGITDDFFNLIRMISSGFGSVLPQQPQQNPQMVPQENPNYVTIPQKPSSIFAGQPMSFNRMSQEQPYIKPNILEHLKLREGVRNQVYKDSLGNLTVGVGHLVTPEDNLKLGDMISEEQINAFLEKDLDEAHNAALTQAKEAGRLGDDEFVKMLTSVNYQLGTGWTKSFSNTWNHIKNKRYSKAVSNLKKSKWYAQTPVRVEDFIEVLKET